MNPIRTQTRNARPIKFGGGNDLAIYTYLQDVDYQVMAHFDWNYHREDMVKDRNGKKHLEIARRMIERGGRRDVFLGTRECQGYVERCTFGEGDSFYDHYGVLSFDLMFHGFDYPDELGKSELRSRFWRPKMIDGVINFLLPEECDPKLIKQVRFMHAIPPGSIGLDEPCLVELLQG
jgi:CRISPR-associated protein Cas5d